MSFELRVEPIFNRLLFLIASTATQLIVTFEYKLGRIHWRACTLHCKLHRALISHLLILSCLRLVFVCVAGRFFLEVACCLRFVWEGDLGVRIPCLTLIWSVLHDYWLNLNVKRLLLLKSVLMAKLWRAHLFRNYTIFLWQANRVKSFQSRWDARTSPYFTLDSGWGHFAGQNFSIKHLLKIFCWWLQLFSVF